MPSERSYPLPIEQTQWQVPNHGLVTLTWNYEDGRDRMLALYEKGKDKQWNAQHRLDWSIEVNPASPDTEPDDGIPIYGSALWESLSPARRDEIRHHVAAWTNSQFLHGEQGALICAAKIVTTVPDLDAKFYASTQVIDEARHVEMYSRYLREKVRLSYPIESGLASLLNSVINDSRWDMTYLGMQVIIEGLALAAFALLRDYTKEPLARAINAFVMQDEARHVAFGRMALRDYYPELTAAERNEREDFVVEASHLMQRRFRAQEVWEELGLPVHECEEYADRSPVMRTFRKLLFSRIVPTVKDIGLWGPRVQRAFADLDVIGFADLDAAEMERSDEEIARTFDRQVPPEGAEQAIADSATTERAAEVHRVIEAGRE